LRADAAKTRPSMTLFHAEYRDFEEGVEGIRCGYEDVRAGRRMSAEEFLDALRIKHDLPR
jgi:hypothetical protein